ncbi:helix-turn-helix domain-containing protein [Paenibacillus konkukensis]|uniref:helix-turn-helix domain-containing protein n=1 Tax=Paenibacillus konkukensis TaxID=2020716 RepID=UPI00201DD647|nr:helix-turn-helix domain-containing protein [Paenibacillus konkukensis]
MARQKSMFRKLFISYIVILAVPLFILGGIVYYFNVVSYQREVSEANLAKLTQVRNQIDLELKSLREIIYHISSQADMYADPYTAAPDEKGDRHSMIAPQLMAYKDHYPFIDEIMFYYRGDTKVYLTSGQYDYQSFENNVKKNYNWAGASVFKELNSVSAPKSFRVETKGSDMPDDSNMLAFLYPVPLLETIPQASVLFTVKETEFFSKFQNILGNFEGAVFIYDPYYRSLVSLNHQMGSLDMTSLEEQLRTFKGTGIFNVTSGGMNLIATRMVSEETDWSYIIAMPDSFFYKSVNTNSTLIVGIIFILLAAGFVGALLFSLKNYKPIKVLLSQFTKSGYEESDQDIKGKNEFEIIRLTFESALQKNKDMLMQMNAQRPLVKDQCLLTLLGGKKIDPGERDYLIKCSNLILDGSAYYCMVLSTHPDDTEGPELGHIIALLENVYFNGGRGYGVEVVNGNYVAVIIVLQEYPADVKSKQQDIAGNLVQQAKENLGLQMIVGIGKIYRSIEQLNASYLEASAVLFDNQINNKKAVHFFDDIENAQEQINWYPMKEQALYIQSLKQGDQAVALETLRALIEQLEAGTISYYMVKCLCFDIVNHILKAMNQMNFRNFSVDIKELIKFNSLQEFQKCMESITLLFCSQVNLQKEKENVELKNKIIFYINEHFKDSSLSLEHIAGQFGLSTSFVSRFIKDETGVNFVDYLSNLRMNEVKLQLQYTDKLIQEIVTDVGYLNTPSFVRKFKAMEGVTPGQYRQITGKG